MRSMHGLNVLLVEDRWSWSLYLMYPTHLRNEDQSFEEDALIFVFVYLCLSM